jgi:hypothetical protein
MHTVTLGGKQWVINEPVFKDLKVILAALNRLNNPHESDFNLIADVQLIINRVLGERHVRKFKRYCWEAWKIPTPNADEVTALLAVMPEICGLQTATRADAMNRTSTDAMNRTSTDAMNRVSTDWDALYWRVIRQTGWTWQEVDTTMTMSRLAAMQENLNHSPAVESLVAAYLGYDYTPTETLENKIDNWLASQGKDNG